MIRQDLFYDLYPFFSRHIGQAEKSGVYGSLQEDEFPEILVQGHENAALARGPCQERAVPGIRSPLPRLNDIVPSVPQPLGKAPTGAAVEQELHRPVIFTASRLSWAMTACAYSRQASTSFGSRSG